MIKSKLFNDMAGLHICSTRKERISIFMVADRTILLLMMLIPSGACIILGIILQIIAATRKKRVAIGPVLIAAGIIFVIIGIVTAFSLESV